MGLGSPGAAPRDFGRSLLARGPARLGGSRPRPRFRFGSAGLVWLARGRARFDFGSRADPGASTLGAAILVLPLLALGCGGASPSPPLSGASQGQIATGAVVTAIAAGTLWAVGGGCRLQGCPYGSYCNKETGFCDVRRCDQGCPDGTVCNEGLGRCQVSAPPAVPNDFLPQDDARLPPGTN